MTTRHFILFYKEYCYWLKTEDDVIKEGSKKIKISGWIGKTFDDIKPAIEHHEIKVYEIKPPNADKQNI